MLGQRLRKSLHVLRWMPAAVLATVVPAGCTNAPVVTGNSSFEVLGSPSDVALPSAGIDAIEQTGERIEFIPAYPRQPLAKPVYPPAALAGGARDYVVYVTATVDEAGHVCDVAPSWQRVRLSQPFADDFVAAAIATVEAWQLAPAIQVYFRRGAEGAEEYVRCEKVAQTFEVKFVFETSGNVQL